jgi:hypothetical protein
VRSFDQDCGFSIGVRAGYSVAACYFMDGSPVEQPSGVARLSKITF